MGVEHEIDGQAPVAGLPPECSTQDVAASLSGSRWAVRAGDWPDLPKEVVELLAAPVVVTTHEVAARQPESGADRPAPAEARPARRGYGECMPSFLAPVAVRTAAPGHGTSDATPAAEPAPLPRARRSRRRI